MTALSVKYLRGEMDRCTERKTKRKETWLLLCRSWRWVTCWNRGGRGLKRLDGAKSETASPFVTQVPSIPRDQADQLTRPQSTPEPSERWMSGRVDGWIKVVVGVSYAAGLFKVTGIFKMSCTSEREKGNIHSAHLSQSRERIFCLLISISRENLFI